MKEEQQSDDKTILNEDILWRRISQAQLVPDEIRGGIRPTSSAFNNHRNGTPMSVALATIFLETGDDPKEYLKEHNVVGLASFTAGFARQLKEKQGVIRKPLKEDPAHAEVVGKKTRSVRKEFAYNATWVIRPPNDIEIDILKTRS